MIWKKHLFKQLFFTFCFCFFSLFFLFVIIDLSTRIKSLHQQELGWGGYLLYYLYQLIRNGEIILPLAALISLTKVSLHFNHSRELIALLASGLSRKKISQPFLLFGMLCFCLLLFNYQYLQPSCYLHLAEQKKFEKWDSSSLTPVRMEDQSLFLFRHFQPQKKELSGCIWFKDSDTIIHMQSIQLNKPSLATGVEIFAKMNTGNFILQEKKSEFFFPEDLLPNDPSAAFCPIRWQSITQLFSYLSLSFPLSEKESQVASFACYKLSFPVLFLIIYLAVLFLCFRFHRSNLSFWIYVFSIFGLLFSFTLLKALLILSESQIFSPYLAFGSVTLTSFTYCVIRYAKL